MTSEAYFLSFAERSLTALPSDACFGLSLSAAFSWEPTAGKAPHSKEWIEATLKGICTAKMFGVQFV